MRASRPATSSSVDDLSLAPPLDPQAVGALATRCLKLEVETWPKPGLVSHFDNGSHGDMDAAMLRRSADTLQPFFSRLAQAGRDGAGMDELRAIGKAAEGAMLATTSGINTHRGAIFGLGLLCAAAGRRETSTTLGAIVRREWGPAIRSGPIVLHSHGTEALRRHGAPGARGEAVSGFSNVYKIGVPALRLGARLAPNDPEAARVQAIFALIAGVDDTNLLHRGGTAGLAYARAEAVAFLRAGGVGAPDWRIEAARVHAGFVARNLSPGGCADLLALSLFVVDRTSIRCERDLQPRRLEHPGDQQRRMIEVDRYPRALSGVTPSPPGSASSGPEW